MRFAQSLIERANNPELKREAKLPPPGIKARLEKIFDACDADERRILQLLAVWGWQGITPPIEFNDVLDLLPLTYLKQKIENLVNREVLVTASDGARYEFKNRDYFPLLIYERAPEEERQYWHARIAMHLKNRGVSGDPVALHVACGAPGNETYRAILKLGRKLLIQKGDVAIARDLFERGMSLTKDDNPKLFACFAANAMDAYMQEGRYGRIEEISKLADVQGAWLAILNLKMTAACLQQRKYDDFESFANKVRSNLPQGLTPLSVVLLNYEARKEHDLAGAEAGAKIAHLNKAKALFEEAGRLEEKLPAKARLRVKNNNLGIVLMALGEYDAAIKELGLKLAKHKKEENVFGVLFSSIALADSYRLTGNFGAAEAIAGQVIELAKRTRQTKWLSSAHQLLANIHYSQDRFEKAIEEDNHRMACSAALEGRGEFQRTLAGIWNHKGHCLKELGNFDLATLNFQAVLENNPTPYFSMSASEGMGEILIKIGKPEEGIKYINEAESLVEKMPEDTVKETYSFSLPLLRALALVRMKRHAEAKPLIADLKDKSGAHKEWAKKFDDFLKEYNSAPSN